MARGGRLLVYALGHAEQHLAQQRRIAGRQCAALGLLVSLLGVPRARGSLEHQSAACLVAARSVGIPRLRGDLRGGIKDGERAFEAVRSSEGIGPGDYGVRHTCRIRGSFATG